MALTDLLGEFVENPPSGYDLEYDAAFQAMEMAAKPGEERQAGSEIIAAEDPDYRDVMDKALTVIQRSHDLRAAIHYGHAATMINGYAGLAEATSYIRGLLEKYWDTCYPELDLDDPDDLALFRVNTLRGLVDGQTIMRAVRLAPLTQSNMFGRVSLRDLAVADGEMTAPEGEHLITDASAISAAFQDTDAGTLTGIGNAARQALEDVRAIEKVFDDKVPGQGPDLSALVRLLRKAVERVNEATGVEEGDSDVAAAPEGEDTDAESAGTMTRTVSAPPGTISSGADVQKALDRILEYYRKHEPSSPVPVLLERAKRLVGADFVSILKDMAPLGVENVFLIGGLEDSE